MDSKFDVGIKILHRLYGKCIRILDNELTFRLFCMMQQIFKDFKISVNWLFLNVGKLLQNGDWTENIISQMLKNYSYCR